tara:strand:- start:694 stop:1308 length:615 start_codon:yes stop_codon:yes gene_type:complete
MANQEKLKSLIGKINWLYKSLADTDFKNVSSLEKALIKENVLMFYDEIENIEIEIQEEIVSSVTSEKLVSSSVEIPEIVVEKIETSMTIESPVEEEIVDEQTVTDLKSETFEKTIEFQRQITMPKRDMREIIDLNKSFIFKVELFNENNDIYNQFIKEINSTRTEADALSFVVSWTEKMNWVTEENKAYELLLNAIEKRFLPLM